MNDTPPTEQAECLMQNGVDDDDTMTQLGAIGRKKTLEQFLLFRPVSCLFEIQIIERARAITILFIMKLLTCPGTWLVDKVEY